jgi:hypothetical protein
MNENVAYRKVLHCTYVMEMLYIGKWRLKVTGTWENKVITGGYPGIEWETETITAVKEEDCSGRVTVVVY